jgi:hypothetical protein
LQALVAPETAGDPMSAQTWVRSSLRTLSRRLGEAGHAASPPTVGRMLTQMKYSLHVNAKKIEARATHPDRAAQFDYIAEQCALFKDAGWPIISVDTKKKELIGAFKNNGRAWCRDAEAVNVHDFLSEAVGRAVPYGVYDVQHHRGTVYVGTSGDTAQFAVDAIARWWQTQGQGAYPPAEDLLILADGGGSNDARSRLWKQQLQEHLCDGLGLRVTVCHYPTGCSKWNPIEHRLFGPISLNWAGHPLRTVETMLAYIRGTTTATGLAVRAERLDGVYPTGQRIAEREVKTWDVRKHDICPAWNYTISPRTGAAAHPTAPPSKREVIA